MRVFSTVHDTNQLLQSAGERKKKARKNIARINRMSNNNKRWKMSTAYLWLCLLLPVSCSSDHSTVTASFLPIVFVLAQKQWTRKSWEQLEQFPLSWTLQEEWKVMIANFYFHTDFCHFTWSATLQRRLAVYLLRKRQNYK